MWQYVDVLCCYSQYFGVGEWGCVRCPDDGDVKTLPPFALVGGLSAANESDTADSGELAAWPGGPVLVESGPAGARDMCEESSSLPAASETDTGSAGARPTGPLLIDDDPPSPPPLQPPIKLPFPRLSIEVDVGLATGESERRDMKWKNWA